MNRVTAHKLMRAQRRRKQAVDALTHCAVAVLLVALCIAVLLPLAKAVQ